MSVSDRAAASTRTASRRSISARPTSTSSASGRRSAFSPRARHASDPERRGHQPCALAAALRQRRRRHRPAAAARPADAHDRRRRSTRLRRHRRRSRGRLGAARGPPAHRGLADRQLTTSACGRSCASSPASTARAWRRTRARCSTSRSASTDRPASIRTSESCSGPCRRARRPSSSTHTQVLMAVAAVAGLVLLMACGNVANLLILTGLRRTAELSLKAALGAGRGRLLREVFLQAVILAGCGRRCRARSGAHGRRGSSARRSCPRLAATIAPIDVRLTLLTVLICAAVALLLGVRAGPAVDVDARRWCPGQACARPAPSRLLESFVALQVALSVPLLVGTLLFAVSFWKIAHVDLGRRPGPRRRREGRHGRRRPSVRAARRPPPHPGTPGDAARSDRDCRSSNHANARRSYARSSRSRLRSSRVGSYSLPMINAVDPSFLDADGHAGRRGPRPSARPTTVRARPRVAVVNEGVARRFWHGASPIGRCIARRQPSVHGGRRRRRQGIAVGVAARGD